MADTAAEAVIVNQAVYNQMKVKPDLTDAVVLTGLDQSTGIEGWLMTNDLAIGPHTFKWKVYVAEPPDQCLLGLDFLIHHGVDINLSTNSITIQGEEILARLCRTTSGPEGKFSQLRFKKWIVILDNNMKIVTGECRQGFNGDIILQPCHNHPGPTSTTECCQINKQADSH